jgi:hypothetical protein
MLRTAISIATTLIIAASLWIYGCGSSDLLDEVGGRYTTSVVFTDADDETMTIDVARDECDDNATLSGGLDDLEVYTDVLADITITVAADAPGITITGYTLEYLGELSEDGTHTLVMPPTLNNLPDRGSNNLFIDSAASRTFTITCFSTDQKEDYRDLIGWTFYTTPIDEDGNGSFDYLFPYWAIAPGTIYEDLETSRYTIRITLHCTDEYGVDRDIEIRRTIYLGSYDNC